MLVLRYQLWLVFLWDWLILTVFQLAQLYFMPWGYGIEFIILLYLYFVIITLEIFAPGYILCNFKYSYLIQIIFPSWWGFKYSFLIQLIFSSLCGFKYSFLIQIIFSSLCGFKHSFLIQIIFPKSVWFQVYLSNTNNIPKSVWFQVFLSNTNNFHKSVWFKVFLSIQIIFPNLCDFKYS